MNTIKNEIKISGIILFGAVFASSAVIAMAQTGADAPPTPDASASSQGITFPVPELGGCTSKEDCRNYCNASEHMEACIAFAKNHGLMNKDEASRADNFRKTLQGNGGPGGCKTPAECRKFCSDIKNLEVCTKFAQTQGVKGEEVDHAQKIVSFIKSGGAMPGGCTSKEECQKYCSDFSHAEECAAFAKSAGIKTVQGEGVEGGIPSGQFQKFLELAKNGETPGACKSKEDCESYCRSDAHFQECLDFGKKVGFVSSDRAEKLKALGGKGPGGCDSPESCSAFCNDPSHQEQCFAFAKEHNLIDPAKINDAQKGAVRLREGLSQAPAEVQACLNAQLGQDAVDQLQSGAFTPGSGVTRQLKECFEKFGQKAEPGEVFKKAPADVIACAKAKLGDDFSAIQSGQTAPTAEAADTFRVCFQQHEFERTGSETQGKNVAVPPQRANDFLRSVPSDVAACLQQKLGDGFERLKSGEAQITPEVKETVHGCLEAFQPKPQERMKPEGAGDAQKRPQPQAFPAFPAEVISCLTDKFGADAVRKFQSGETQPTAELKNAAQTCMEGLRQKMQNSQQAPAKRPSDESRAPGIPSFPPEVMACLKAKLGEDIIAKLQAGSVSPDIKEVAVSCMQNAKTNAQPEIRPAKPLPNFEAPTMKPQAPGDLPSAFQVPVFPSQNSDNPAQ